MRALLIAAAFVVAARAQAADGEKELRQAVWGGHFREGIRRYGELERAGAVPAPQASYLAGWAYWQLREPEKARPLLEKARDAGFKAGGNRLQPDALLEMIDRYAEAKPPAVELPGVNAEELEVFSGETTSLTRPILEALPRIMALGRTIFGGAPPRARLFLFARTGEMLRFYEALGMKASRSTGTANFVVICEQKIHRATPARTLALVLHETGHAWVAGYLRERYDVGPKMPVYMTEGLAVYISSLWDETVLTQAPEKIRRWRDHGATAPRLDDLERFSSFHDSGQESAHYLLAGLLMRRLLGPASTGTPKIPALLDALARRHDAAAAWRDATGKDVRAEYTALAAEYWPAR